MTFGLVHILGSSSSSGDWGGLCFAAILIIGWVIKAVSGAIKQTAQQAEQRRRVTGQAMVGRPGSPLQMPPPLPARGQVAGNRAGKGKRGKVQAPPVVAPPPPVTTAMPVMAPMVGSVQRPATGAARRGSSAVSASEAKDVLRSMQRRIIWAEVLGKPLALRGEDGDA